MTIEIKCNRCGSKNYIYFGWGWFKGVKNVHKRRCKECGKIYSLHNGVEDVGGLIYSRCNKSKKKNRRVNK